MAVWTVGGLVEMTDMQKAVMRESSKAGKLAESTEFVLD
jgi:hypothetical protein